MLSKTYFNNMSDLVAEVIILKAQVAVLKGREERTKTLLTQISRTLGAGWFAGPADPIRKIIRWIDEALATGPRP